MLKKSLLLAVGALLAQGAMAETLSPEAAYQRATKQENGRRLVSAGATPRLAYTQATARGEAAVYVFNKPDGGSLLLSASTLAVPVLGYTDSGTFDPSDMPPQLKYWLEEYASQIAYAEEHDLTPLATEVAASYPSEWKFVAPLLTTTWDQGKPYNDLLESTSYATGCVATAMAQVMNYHKYPEIGQGSNTYTVEYRNGAGVLVDSKTYSMNFAEQKFDWANMLDSYSGSYTEAQANAVAYLMKACGYSADMTYGPSSGTQVEEAAEALPKYFKYDNSIESLQRYGYTNTEWATILYQQITTVGPVIFSGHSIGGFAHAFVADGYDGQGYFHINWGWSGTCNGYYSLDALNPTVQGTGGSNYGGYNFSQGMVVNIMPDKGGKPADEYGQITLLGNVSATNSLSVITMTMSEANPGNLANNSLFTVKPTFGIEMLNTITGEKAYSQASGLYFGGQQYQINVFEPGQYVDQQMAIRARFDSSLPDGRYKVSMVWKDAYGTGEWQHFEIANGCHDYVYVTYVDGTYSIENLPMERFTISSAEVVTPLYMRNPCEIQFTVTNPYDIELSQSVIPVLLYGEDKVLSFEGDSQLVTVGPKETKTVVCVYTFSQVSGGQSPTLSQPKEYTLGAYDYSLLMDKYYMSGDFRESYYGDLGTATMKRPESSSSLTMREIKIDNAVESGSEDGIGMVYRVGNFSKVELSVTVMGTRGFVAAPLSAVVYEFDNSTNSNGNVVYERNFDELIYVEVGTMATRTMSLDLSNVDNTKLYNIEVYYVMQNQRIKLGNAKLGAASGVDEIVGEGDLVLSFDGTGVTASADCGVASLTIYDLSGKSVAQVSNGSSSETIDLSGIAKGIYIVSATDAAGRSKVLKIRN